jgi:hypothetical protein
MSHLFRFKTPDYTAVPHPSGEAFPGEEFTYFDSQSSSSDTTEFSFSAGQPQEDLGASGEREYT